MDPTLITHTENVDGTSEALSDAEKTILVDLGKVGAFYGRKKSKTHPRMKPFIYGQRNGIEIIDGAATTHELAHAADFLRSVCAEKGAHLLIVGTQPAAKQVVQKFAHAHHFSFVVERWIGGTLTNFKMIHGRIETFKKMKADRDSGRFEKYTKKERLELDREIARMAAMFGGLQYLNALPNAMIVIDAMRHQNALQEARRTSIPVVALMNTDGDPESATYTIPVNTNSRAALEWVFDYFEKEVFSFAVPLPLSEA